MTVAQLNEIIEYLEKHGYECTPIGNDDGDVFIDVIINNKEIRLKCMFPKSFPYTFPKVYILKEFYKNIAPLPHINEAGYICTFDDNKAFPNFYEPNKVVYESIKKATEIIEDGISGVNRHDFIDEFTSYWGLESASDINVFALFSADNNSRLLYAYYKNSHDFYISDDKFLLKEYLLYAKEISVQERDIDKCLYLPFENPWYPPYPKTNKEIYLKVKEEPEAFNHYYNYLKNKNNKIPIIIFSHEINEEKYLAGWIHRPVGNYIKGFRKGKISPGLSYLRKDKEEKIAKLDVTHLDRRRLFKRGGDDIVSNSKVSITGCGSIGSYLIQVLAELGVDDFTLIDKETLCAENIARHMCGASEIGNLKTEVIKERLIKHYPYMKCKSIPKDAFDVISEDIDTFNNCDINFVVVGSIPIESKFIELFNQGVITKPLVIMWVEPYLLGAHAVIIQKNQDIVSCFYGNEYNFKFSVLSNGESFTKREAGCQSTYVPYSAFEAKQFIYSFMDYFHNEHMLKNTVGNYVYSWCGNLKWARKENIKISDFWLSKENRTINIKRLDKYEEI